MLFFTNKCRPVAGAHKQVEEVPQKLIEYPLLDPEDNASCLSKFMNEPSIAKFSQLQYFIKMFAF